ncbi:hypothetical protein [Exiguobacterium sp. s143]|uniref:hypothetical protein n=1 Tax=Exiguobacterium sp. s143 TaxID=2751201 RepID=UPI0010582485|nr:hypothetical protein [Exiguobacterium sp. s143]
MNSYKNPEVILIVLLIISGFLFYFGNQMTAAPGSSSGNGNLAILSMIALVFIIPIFIFFLMITLKNLRLKLGYLVTMIILSLSYVIVGFLYQSNEYSKYKNLVKEIVLAKGVTKDLDYIDSITSGIFSPFMNSQFFNLNTYVMFVCFVIFVSSMIILYFKKEEHGDRGI